MVGSSAWGPRSAPGSPTLVSPVRIGDCPVMNAARPAVQLCWPYQSVNIVPSFATRSMLGVRYPMMPWLYALTLNQPMSSPQMTRMLGFFDEAGMCFLQVEKLGPSKRGLEHTPCQSAMRPWGLIQRARRAKL